MPQTMTLDEKLTILYKGAALRQASNEEELSRLVRSVPMPPNLVKFIWEKLVRTPK